MDGKLKIIYPKPRKKRKFKAKLEFGNPRNLCGTYTKFNGKRITQ